jgi:RepB DNA-primase from phage plasmid
MNRITRIELETQGNPTPATGKPINGAGREPEVLLYKPVAPKPVDLKPDIEAGRAFLQLLASGETRFTFQTFDDDKTRKDPKLATVRHGRLDEHWKGLRNLSLQGAGVFVAVNETDLQGRRSANILKVRAVWCEADDGAKREFPLAPSIIVESSPGKFHYYWLLDVPFDADEAGRADFAAIMSVMVARYGSDPNAKDITRVLRLPGFLHQKDPAKPFMVRVCLSRTSILP